MGSSSHNRKSLVQKWSKCSNYLGSRDGNGLQKSGSRWQAPMNRLKSLEELRKESEERRALWRKELEGVTFTPEPGWAAIKDAGDVKELLTQGLNCKEVGEELGHSTSTIMRYREKLLGLAGHGAHLKKSPEYIRKAIPYEFETDVKMDSWRWGCYSMDEPRGETGRSYHEMFPSSFPSPDEELMQREIESDSHEFETWLRAWIRGLPPRSASVAQLLMEGEPVTVDDVLIFKADALLLFQNEKPQQNHA